MEAAVSSRMRFMTGQIWRLPASRKRTFGSLSALSHLLELPEAQGLLSRHSLPRQDEVYLLAFHINPRHPDRNDLTQCQLVSPCGHIPHAMGLQSPVSNRKVVPLDESPLQNFNNLYHQSNPANIRNDSFKDGRIEIIYSEE